MDENGGNSMKKADFIAMVADRVGLTKKDTEKVIDAAFDTIGDILVSGDKLQLTGFGSFETKERPERTGRNPKTQEPMVIAAATVPVFKPGNQLKEKVNQ